MEIKTAFSSYIFVWLKLAFTLDWLISVSEVKLKQKINRLGTQTLFWQNLPGKANSIFHLLPIFQDPIEKSLEVYFPMPYIMHSLK